MNNEGIRNFVRVNASNGKVGDILFTTMYRQSGWEGTPRGPAGHISYASPTTGQKRRRQHTAINQAVDQVKYDLQENPLEEGEQLNLIGYSYGSVLQAQTALRLADEGTYIDNLILIGSPIESDSDLYKELSENENIGNVLRINIEGDFLSDPEDIIQYLKGAIQNSSDDGEHFDLARPGKEVDKAIQIVAEWLRENGVK